MTVLFLLVATTLHSQVHPAHIPNDFHQFRRKSTQPIPMRNDEIAPQPPLYATNPIFNPLLVHQQHEDQMLLNPNTTVFDCIYRALRGDNSFAFIVRDESGLECRFYVNHNRVGGTVIGKMWQKGGEQAPYEAFVGDILSVGRIPASDGIPKRIMFQTTQQNKTMVTWSPENKLQIIPCHRFNRLRFALGQMCKSRRGTAVGNEFIIHSVPIWKQNYDVAVPLKIRAARQPQLVKGRSLTQGVAIMQDGQVWEDGSAVAHVTNVETRWMDQDATDEIIIVIKTTLGSKIISLTPRSLLAIHDGITFLSCE